MEDRFLANIFKAVLFLHLVPAVVTRSEKFSYVDVNVTQTLVDITKENLLRAFGLDLNSKPNKPVVPHDYMLQVFSKLEGQRRNGRQDDVNTVRGLVDNGQNGFSWLPFPHLNLDFDMKGIPNSDKLVSSELRILQIPSEMQRASRGRKRWRTGALLKVELYGKVAKPVRIASASGNQTGITDDVRMVYLDSFTLDTVTMERKWITFDVGNFVEKMWKMGTDMIGFMVRVTDAQNGLIFPPNVMGIRKVQRGGSEKPLLVLYMNDQSSKSSNNNGISTRSKRGASRRGKKRDQKGPRRRRNKNLCRRKPMYVNFDDFGWTNWIIAPNGYQAYHCSGSCSYPIAAHLNPTNHATIKSIVNSLDSDVVPTACCVPDKLSSLSILYLDGNDRVVYKQKDDMVVERCGCK